MPHDPIDRWEWEGGTVALDSACQRPENVRGRPVEPAAHADAEASAVQLDDLDARSPE